MFKNLITLAISSIVAIILVEGVLRLVLEPMDYLSVDPVRHAELGHAIPPYKAGHDEWGYRNKDVPEEVEVLAIGDSMTYGMMAKSFQSWPSRYAEISGKSVYSASLGGYGPLHYLHILKTRTPELSPKQVIVMIYPGNDLLDIYNLAYANDYWARFRKQAEGSDHGVTGLGVFTPSNRPQPITKKIRNWLARTSVFYRLVTQSEFFNGFRARETAVFNENAIEIQHLSQAAFLDPLRRHAISDYEDPRIKEALEILDLALGEMKSFSDTNGVALHVAIMPVKERVFDAVIGDDIEASKRETLTKLVKSLESIEADLVQMLTDNGIDFTILRPKMEAALRSEMIYPPTDGHPNAAGYLVAAKALVEAVN